MRSTSTRPERTPDTLAAVRAEVLALGADARDLAIGEEIAGLVAALTDDASLSAAALLAQALRRDLPLDDEALAGSVDAATLRSARQLARLAVVGLPATWSPEQPLAAEQSEALRKMLLAVAADPRVVVARLATELVHLRHARELPTAERQRLAAGVRLLFAPLANRLGLWQLKWELEDIAFRELEPAAYHQVAKALAERRADREQYVSSVCATLRSALTAAGIAAEVYGRPKHIYSIWNKMQRKQLAFDEIFDIRAVRIVVASVEQCYAALSVVHGLWPFIAGEFDDYIATPKDNLYRSIHTAVTGPGGQPLEVQIRTRDMHEHAELGVAAHWRYKEGGGRDARYEGKIEWARRFLQPAADEAGDNIELLRRAVFADRIYALTPRGEAIDLPQGATPLDFAYHLHTQLGHDCRGAKVDGRIVPLNHRLANGVVVEIITGRGGGPSRDWLNEEDHFLVSPRSRAKVRAWFRAQEAAEAARTPEPARAEAARAESSRSAQPRSDAAAATPEALLAGLQKRAPPRRRSRSLVDIEGVDDLPTALAGCCHPVAPEAIVGYVTLGRGVTVHRAGCRSLARMRAQHADRVLKARWNLPEDALLPVVIRVQAFDRNGLLRDVSDVLTQSRLSIEGVNSNTNAADQVATIEIRTAVRNAAQLANIVKQLQTVDSVIRSERIYK